MKSFKTSWYSLSRRHFVLPRLWLAVAVLLLASSGHDQISELDKIKARGHIIMLTLNGATTYYLGAEGETGFEFELGRAFADFIGVPLEVVTLPHPQALKQALALGQGDFIAAGLPSPVDDARLTSGPVYETVAPMVVYRQGSAKPDAIEELSGGSIALLDGKGYETLLIDNGAANAGLEWFVAEDSSIEDLFDAISREEVTYTVADSNVVELNRRFFPAIGIAFDLEPQMNLAWVVRREKRESLIQVLQAFFDQIQSNNRLAEIKAHHYQADDGYEPVGTFTFMDQVASRLPALKSLFKQAAEQVDLDWALLAAVGYQESHWDPRAVSPTGVRGVMMLTQRTAGQLGVDNRLDPEQSILGGARYLRSMLDRLPDRIQMPDRLYLALAAYNIGLGHLEDARVITQRQGKDPDRWLDVKEHLPLLTQERWYRQTRYGYARGYEAVSYVSNIRTFYEILLWMDQREHPLLTSMQTSVEPDAAP